MAKFFTGIRAGACNRGNGWGFNTSGMRALERRDLSDRENRPPRRGKLDEWGSGLRVCLGVGQILESIPNQRIFRRRERTIDVAGRIAVLCG